jgi:hypothetical protein
MADIDSSNAWEQKGTASAKSQPHGLHLLSVTEKGDRPAEAFTNPVDWVTSTVVDKWTGRGSLREEVSKRLGVQIRENAQGDYEYFYKAGGADHPIAYSPATIDGINQAQNQIQYVANVKIRELERDYKVKFAAPGEEIEHKTILSDDCKTSEGEMIHAVSPTPTQLYAVEQALKHSQPSQLGPDGNEGIKIYFLDKQPYPPLTEGKSALGLFISSDKDKHRALYVTPEGAALPPTNQDVTQPEGRNLMWVIIHELTHNSQQNMWKSGVVPEETELRMGWEKHDLEYNNNHYDFWLLSAKNGHMYDQGTDNCKMPPVWYRVNNDGEPIDTVGNVVNTIAKAEHITGADLRKQLPITPPTYYFTNPKEMMSEALTAFRFSADSRATLLQESPAIYGVVRSYDQQELDRLYGVDEQGQSKYVRSPDGFAVPRGSAVEESIIALERNNSRPY